MVASGFAVTATPAMQDNSDDLDALSTELYAELKGLAATLRRQHQVRDTLNTTALVSEAYVKLSGSGQWEDRRHFLRVAARAVRQILVDEARYWLAEKRQDADQPVPIDQDMDPGFDAHDAFLVELDGALRELESWNPRLARLVEYRYFAGYPDEDVAQLLGTTTRTLRRDWIKARAWLQQALDWPDSTDGNIG